MRMFVHPVLVSALELNFELQIALLMREVREVSADLATEILRRHALELDLLLKGCVYAAAQALCGRRFKFERSHRANTRAGMSKGAGSKIEIISI
jgi:hypothetical protein